MAVPCAVIGLGQTKYKKQRSDVSLDGLVREAALRAMEDAGVDFSDLDAIVIGKAPDALEGVMMPELSLCDALGAVGKTMYRVHTAGSVGASTAVSAATIVESGLYDTVLTVGYEKQSEGNATWTLSGGRSGGQGAGGTFAPWMREYISRAPRGRLARTRNQHGLDVSVLQANPSFKQRPSSVHLHMVFINRRPSAYSIQIGDKGKWHSGEVVTTAGNGKVNVVTVHPNLGYDVIGATHDQGHFSVVVGPVCGGLGGGHNGHIYWR